MREIKFRAIILGRNATIYFDLSDLVHPARKDLFSKKQLLIPWLLAGNIPDEFIGWKDKNAKDIYVGDIVQFKESFGNVTVIRPVEWEDGCFTIDNPFTEDNCARMLVADNNTVEVIGNIYENKELQEQA